MLRVFLQTKQKKHQMNNLPLYFIIASLVVDIIGLPLICYLDRNKKRLPEDITLLIGTSVILLAIAILTSVMLIK